MRQYLTRAGQAIRLWKPRRWLAALGLSVATAIALGIVTVLIPNPIFHRDIPPTAWSYPVWIATSVLSGMLMATYVANESGVQSVPAGAPAQSAAADETENEQGDDRSSVWGMIGAFGAWFAIGCPVCNKLALLALGYSGAITYFAPLQPWLAAVSLVLLVVGLVIRLSGELACPVSLRVR